MNDDKDEPICIFGIIADVQYADIDNCIVYGRTRYYRSSIDLVKKAINDWKLLNESSTSTCKDKFKFILQLGDIIEGFRSDKSLRVNHVNKVLDELNVLSKPIYHCWGNHEMYAFDLDFLIQSPLNTARYLNQNENLNYYYCDITNRLRLICLNQYEISLYERDEHKLKNIKSLIDPYLKRKETSTDKTELNYLSRFKIYNGAISQTQLEWLRDQLDYCKSNSRKVILSGHIPLVSDAGDYDGICWNSNEILDLIWSYENLVIIYIAGHYHNGGYYYDKLHNLHHLTLNAILETNPSESDNAYATVSIYSHKLILKNEKNKQVLTINY